MRFLIGYETDEGLRKKVNQDALLINTATSTYGRIGLFIVCDGMGGLSNGELASATVIREMKKWFEGEIPKIEFNKVDKNKVYELVNEKILALNNKILNYGLGKDEKLGTTLSMLLIVNDKYYTFQVGDSRIYKIDKYINQITVDQSLVQREIERGNITEEEALNHPKRNVLLQCIGAKSKVEVEMKFGEVKEGQVFMLCSDGFYKKINKEELGRVLSSDMLNSIDEINTSIKMLIDLAKERKEKDNITSIVVKILS